MPRARGCYACSYVGMMICTHHPRWDGLEAPDESGVLTSRAHIIRTAGGTKHVGPFGLLALHEDVDTARLRRLLAAACEFAEEWSELRGLHQQKLAGRPLRRAAWHALGVEPQCDSVHISQGLWPVP